MLISDSSEHVRLPGIVGHDRWALVASPVHVQKTHEINRPMGWIASRIFHRFDNSCSQLPNSKQFPVREFDRSFGRHTGGDSQKRTLLHDRDVLLGGDHLQILKSASSVSPRRAIREEQEQHGSIIQHAAPLIVSSCSSRRNNSVP